MDKRKCDENTEDLSAKRKKTSDNENETNNIDEHSEEVITNGEECKETSTEVITNGKENEETSSEVITNGKEHEETSSPVENGNTPNKKDAFKICSWNIAGLRAWVKKNGLDYLKEENADIVCLQETKCLEKDLPGEVISMKKGGKLTTNANDYHMYWCSAEQKGYSGVALWTKVKPLSVKYGLGEKKHDNEGRLITAEYEKYYVVTSYVPNSGRKLVRLDYRREWNSALKDYLNNLSNTKPVVFCGDLNVAHKEIDLANPKHNKRNAGFTEEEREDFTALLDDGYVDTYRHFNPEKIGAYTFWTYMGNARAKNVGWRLDYFVVSKSLQDCVSSSEIRPSIMGSDHCPIVLKMDV